MSMLKICGQELELDLFDADTMEVYEKSMDEVVKRAEESKKHTELSNADCLVKMHCFMRHRRLWGRQSLYLKAESIREN